MPFFEEELRKFETGDELDDYSWLIEWSQELNENWEIELSEDVKDSALDAILKRFDALQAYKNGLITFQKKAILCPKLALMALHIRSNAVCKLCKTLKIDYTIKSIIMSSIYSYCFHRWLFVDDEKEIIQIVDNAINKFGMI